MSVRLCAVRSSPEGRPVCCGLPWWPGCGEELPAPGFPARPVTGGAAAVPQLQGS